MEAALFRSKLNTPLLITLISVLILLAPLAIGRFYAVGDTRDVYIPLEHFFANEQRAGRLPVWNPDIAWGYPTIAAAQIGFFYPPLLLLRYLPLAIYLPTVFAAHLLALAIGTYALLKSLRQSSPGAALGALAMALGGFTILHFTHLNILFTIAWIPWQLFLAKRLANTSTRPLAAGAGLALIIGIPFLIGQIQLQVLCVCQ